MDNHALLLIVMRAINKMGKEKFKSTSMFANIRQKQKSKVDIKKAA